MFEIRTEIRGKHFKWQSIPLTQCLWKKRLSEGICVSKRYEFLQEGFLDLVALAVADWKNIGAV